MDTYFDVIERVKKRIDDKELDDQVVIELAAVAGGRLCIRLGVDVLPELFKPICADAVVKMHRRIYYEGISSEGAAGISTSFIDDVMAEYEQEIADWKERKANDSVSAMAVSFL